MIKITIEGPQGEGKTMLGEMLYNLLKRDGGKPALHDDGAAPSEDDDPNTTSHMIVVVQS